MTHFEKLILHYNILINERYIHSVVLCNYIHVALFLLISFMVCLDSLLSKKKKNSFEIPWNVWRLLIHGKLHSSIILFLVIIKDIINYLIVNSVFYHLWNTNRLIDQSILREIV